MNHNVQVVEDGYEFFAKRQLVTLFSAPNYCGDYDNAGGMMTVDERLFCSFQVYKHPYHHGACNFLHASSSLLSTLCLALFYLFTSSSLVYTCLYHFHRRSFHLHVHARLSIYTLNPPSQILKPSEKKAKYQYSGLNSGQPITAAKTLTNKT